MLLSVPSVLSLLPPIRATRRARRCALPLLLGLAILAAPPSRAALPAECAVDVAASNPANPIIELETAAGPIEVELLEDRAPITTANFLAYLDAGEVDGTFAHRNVPGFVLQAGTFRVTIEVEFVPVAAGPAILNEPCMLDEDDPGSEGAVQRCSARGNVCGTLAMAKIGDPVCNSSPEVCVPRPDWSQGEYPRSQYVNSATSGFFFNMADNRTNLDNQNGGFTVFGRVLGNGMEAVNEMAGFAHSLGEVPTGELPYSIQARRGVLVDLASLPSIPLRDSPDFPPDDFGCFDLDTAALMACAFDPNQPDNNFVAAWFGPDDYYGIVAGSCGIQLESEFDFVPPPTSNCDHAYYFAAGIIESLGNPSLDPSSVYTQTPTVPYQLTVEQVDESFAQLERRRAAMGATIIDELATIHLPEPGATPLAIAALGCLLALRRAQSERGPRSWRRHNTRAIRSSE